MSMLAKYWQKLLQGHINAALQVLQYLKGKKDLKFSFSAQNN